MKQIKEVQLFATIKVCEDIKEVAILEEKATENVQFRCLFIKGFQPAVENIIKHYFKILGKGTIFTLKGSADGQCQEAEGKIWIPIEYTKYSWGIDEKNTICLKITTYKI